MYFLRQKMKINESSSPFILASFWDIIDYQWIMIFHFPKAKEQWDELVKIASSLKDKYLNEAILTVIAGECVYNTEKLLIIIQKLSSKEEEGVQKFIEEFLKFNEKPSEM